MGSKSDLAELELPRHVHKADGVYLRVDTRDALEEALDDGYELLPPAPEPVAPKAKGKVAKAAEKLAADTLADEVTADKAAQAVVDDAAAAVERAAEAPKKPRKAKAKPAATDDAVASNKPRKPKSSRK